MTYENKKTIAGTVQSIIDNRTVVVTVAQKKMHPLYGKILRSSRKFLVDATGKEVVVGQVVKAVECKPLSKNKKWSLV